MTSCNQNFYSRHQGYLNLLVAGNSSSGIFGCSTLVISKIIDINSGKFIVQNMVLNITLIFPCPEESQAVT
ncbi:hypothetical protein EC780_26940 [Escherichia coli]|nr:hypothetical protein BE957_26780 [Escherichia coli]AQZ88898.1 hypothetical protein EC725_25065 [Escherichia coli]ARA05383.1 hypothetical protein EC780_26940 [Escherichia coli]